MNDRTETLVRELVSVGVAYEAETERIIARICGYSPAQVRVCCMAASADGTVLQRDIERSFRLSRPAISQMVEQMVANGLVTRDGVDGDKRLKRLVLTDFGRSIADKTNEETAKFFQSAASGLTQQEIDAALSAAAKLKEALVR